MYGLFDTYPMQSLCPRMERSFRWVWIEFDYGKECKHYEGSAIRNGLGCKLHNIFFYKKLNLRKLHLLGVGP